MADVQIDKLTIEIEANSGAATTNIKKLGKAIESLSSTGSLKTVIDSLEKLNEKLSNMSNLSSAVSGINQVSDAMKKATGVSNNMTAQTETLGSSLKNLFSQAFVVAIIQKANTLLESAITNYSKYVEDANLFAVAMGNAADSGGRFAQKMENVLGIDSGEAMRNMAVFQNLTTSFGMASDKAYILSQNLTQLGYDMASFFNLRTEDSFQKLQAAISGELEPIRRLGVDISNARLQQELYNLGINKSINSLSQADKAQLRYIAIMKQTTNAVSKTYVGSGVTKKSAATYTPGTSDQSIASGQYLSGTQTIKGDANLVAGNIKSGVSIFGVTGTYTGGGSSGGSGNNNVEAYAVTSTSPSVSFKTASGTIKIWGYGTITSQGGWGGTTTSLIAFDGDKYYKSAVYGSPSSTSLNLNISNGKLTGLPSGLSAISAIVTRGI